jgi:hypothetical protein
MSEDARSIGSVAAVIGELYWGFAIAFFGSFAGTFSGAFSLAFAGPFAGAFAFTSSLARRGILGLTEELGCSVGGFSARAVLPSGLLGRAEGFEAGLDLALHPRLREGGGPFRAGFHLRGDDRFGHPVEADAHGRVARAIDAGCSEILLWRLQCRSGLLRVAGGDITRRVGLRQALSSLAAYATTPAGRNEEGRKLFARAAVWARSASGSIFAADCSLRSDFAQCVASRHVARFVRSLEDLICNPSMPFDSGS